MDKKHAIAAHLVAIAVCSLFLGGCVTSSEIDKVMQSWVGKHQSELIQAWGPPQTTSSDGKDGTILIYTSYVDLGQQPGQANVDILGRVTYTAPEQLGYSKTRWMYVDGKGYVYFWRWKGI